MAKQVQNILKRGKGSGGLPGGISWGMGLLVGAGAVGFGIQQAMYTGERGLT